ncbi:hypothetical protein LX87_05029 [Larkinella arboricola]|uniref:Uncharacterized protein n=1 Tax=Larkinella arboricola TaxID=643671 RepID=A0A327WPR1_LARAB|nr:hypothetical protein [Larkinella arboricola]RAJ92698.1 hypothetical protein LX87_05029 [Larkinella arboricola]
MMLVKIQEQIVDNFLIPSFTLTKGEIVIIQLPGGSFFRPLEFALIDIITGKATYNNVELVSPLRYVEPFKESWFRQHFFPLTVGTYLNKNANKTNPVYQKIYDIKWITPNTKVQTLASTPQRQLALYTTLSWTNDFIFDLTGIGAQGGQEIYNFVKTTVHSGGSAILLDWTDEFKNDCTKFIQAKYLGKKNV